jgi:hypothetical protein
MLFRQGVGLKNGAEGLKIKPRKGFFLARRTPALNYNYLILMIFL